MDKDTNRGLLDLIKQNFMQNLAGFGAFACIVIYVGLLGGDASRLSTQIPGVQDTSSYSYSVPPLMLLSGILLGCIAGIVSYSQINQSLMFMTTIAISLFALLLSFVALGVGAITH